RHELAQRAEALLPREERALGVGLAQRLRVGQRRLGLRRQLQQQALLLLLEARLAGAAPDLQAPLGEAADAHERDAHLGGRVLGHGVPRARPLVARQREARAAHLEDVVARLQDALRDELVVLDADEAALLAREAAMQVALAQEL